MTSLLQTAIEALRQELKEYGEMLALLEGAQPPAGAPTLCVSAIQTQAQAMESARQATLASRRRLAASLGEAEDSTFSDLIQRLPGPYAGLVEALVRENGELLARVRERAAQHSRLLGRSLRSMHLFLTAFAPEEPAASAQPSSPGALLAQIS